MPTQAERTCRPTARIIGPGLITFQLTPAMPSSDAQRLPPTVLETSDVRHEPLGALATSSPKSTVPINRAVTDNNDPSDTETTAPDLFPEHPPRTPHRRIDPLPRYLRRYYHDQGHQHRHHHRSHHRRSRSHRHDERPSSPPNLPGNPLWTTEVIRTWESHITPSLYRRDMLEAQYHTMHPVYQALVRVLVRGGMRDVNAVEVALLRHRTVAREWREEGEREVREERERAREWRERRERMRERERERYSERDSERDGERDRDPDGQARREVAGQWGGRRRMNRRTLSEMREAREADRRDGGERIEQLPRVLASTSPGRRQPEARRRGEDA
ncbi:hypothetical protein LTS18_002847 [Coniosporium uncinatum]|uniref:Uncharacterized protein n=1 Tax=Coniosporium uncinatum TaxID=93489 RepID=A0ACC3D7D7_9PEZI|nr:hypothetical protein LTS18_002847 [Coniosporium uncinatum]